MLDCYEVANYFLTKVNVEEGEVITNLKLQKLAYYAQSANLAFYDAPLFVESLEAWKQGPVVPDLYHHFESYKSDPLPRVADVDTTLYSSRELKLMDDVYIFFGQFTAWKLRDMTHAETPWQEAAATGSVISHASMRDYFRAHWGDAMQAAVSDPEDNFQELLERQWEPTPATLDAARRYKMGRIAIESRVPEAA